MDDKDNGIVLRKGTSIRFNGYQWGEDRPIGTIVSYNSDTRYYRCAFRIEGRTWKPELSRSEFSLYREDNG